MKLRTLAIAVVLIAALPVPHPARAALTQAQLDAITPHFAQAEKLLKAADWDGVVKEMDSVIALPPISEQTFRAWAMRGIAHRGQGKRDDAISDWRKAIDLVTEIKFSLPDAEVQLGTVKCDLGYAYLEKAGLFGEERGLAKALFEAALVNNPNDVGSVVGLGRVALGFFNSKDNDRAALAFFDRAYKMNPNYADANFWRGKVLNSLAEEPEQKKAAMSLLDRAIELAPSADYYAARATAKHRQAPPDLDAAVADLSKAIELDPKNEDRYLKRAEMQSYRDTPDDAQLLSDYNNALELLTPKFTALEADDTSNRASLITSELTRALEHRGEVLRRGGKLREALTDFNTAHKLIPSSMAAIIGRARIMLAAGRVQQCIDEISAMMPARRKDRDTILNEYAVRGEAFLVQKRWDEALIDFNVAIKEASWTAYNIYAKDANLYWNRARAFNGLEQWDKAQADFNVAVKLKPEYAAKLKGSRYEVALAPHEPDKSVILTNADTPVYHKLLGNEWGAAHSPANAVGEFDKAIALDAGYADAWNNRGAAWMELGNNESALRDFNRAIELKPSDPRFLFNRGGLFVKEGKAAEALADFKKATELDPKVAVFWENLGMVQQGTKDNAGAEASYLKAVATSTDPGAKRANVIRILFVRAAQNIAPSEADMKMLLGSDKDELESMLRPLAAMQQQSPDVAALKALRDAVTAEIAQRPNAAN